jgi:outer membrane receptor protein involved in Fe transport
MLHHLDRISRRALVVAGLLVAAPPALPALVAQSAPEQQSRARLQGVVIDEVTYQPVDSATVGLVGIDGAITTGRWGSFAFPEAPLGPVAIEVSAPGHPSVVQVVDVQDDRVVFVRIVLPSVAAVLAELLVQSPPPYARTSETSRTAADLLALKVPRARVNTGVVGKSDYLITLRANNTLTGNGEPLILVDGVVMARSSAFDALERIPASDVERVEVLRGPAAAFL